MDVDVQSERLLLDNFQTKVSTSHGVRRGRSVFGFGQLLACFFYRFGNSGIYSFFSIRFLEFGDKKIGFSVSFNNIFG